MHIAQLCVIIGISLIGGCTRPAEVNATPAVGAPVVQPGTETPKLTVDGEGLRWFLPGNGAARPLPFGTARATVLASLERVRGSAATGIVVDCGAGALGYANWPDGLSLKFKSDRFVGWGLDRRAAGAIGTAAGVGPGSDRAALESAHSIVLRRTSLGNEFSSGDVHGLLDGTGPTAQITDMWAGASCIAR